jgi:acyl carrier protein
MEENRVKYDNNDIVEVLSNILNMDESEVKNINPDDNLVKYGLVSINAIKLVIALEEKLDFEFLDEDLLFEKFNTLNKLKQLLDNY